MNKTLPLLSSLLLIGIFTSTYAAKPMDAPKATTAQPANPDHTHLVEARKRVNEIPEVLSAQQQAKADHAVLIKVSGEYKQARTKSNASDESYRKLFDEQLKKSDPEAAAILVKERQAFKEKMLKARDSKKLDGKKIGSSEDDDDESHIEQES